MRSTWGILLVLASGAAGQACDGPIWNALYTSEAYPRALRTYTELCYEDCGVGDWDQCLRCIDLHIRVVTNNTMPVACRGCLSQIVRCTQLEWDVDCKFPCGCIKTNSCGEEPNMCSRCLREEGCHPSRFELCAGVGEVRCQSARWSSMYSVEFFRPNVTSLVRQCNNTCARGDLPCGRCLREALATTDTTDTPTNPSSHTLELPPPCLDCMTNLTTCIHKNCQAQCACLWSPRQPCTPSECDACFDTTCDPEQYVACAGVGVPTCSGAVWREEVYTRDYASFSLAASEACDECGLDASTDACWDCLRSSTDRSIISTAPICQDCHALMSQCVAAECGEACACLTNGDGCGPFPSTCDRCSMETCGSSQFDECAGVPSLLCEGPAWDAFYEADQIDMHFERYSQECGVVCYREATAECKQCVRRAMSRDQPQIPSACHDCVSDVVHCRTVVCFGDCLCELYGSCAPGFSGCQQCIEAACGVGSFPSCRGLAPPSCAGPGWELVYTTENYMATLTQYAVACGEFCSQDPTEDDDDDDEDGDAALITCEHCVETVDGYVLHLPVVCQHCLAGSVLCMLTNCSDSCSCQVDNECGGVEARECQQCVEERCTGSNVTLCPGLQRPSCASPAFLDLYTSEKYVPQLLLLTSECVDECTQDTEAESCTSCLTARVNAMTQLPPVCSGCLDDLVQCFNRNCSEACVCRTTYDCPPEVQYECDSCVDIICNVDQFEDCAGVGRPVCASPAWVEIYTESFQQNMMTATQVCSQECLFRPSQSCRQCVESELVIGEAPLGHTCGDCVSSLAHCVLTRCGALCDCHSFDTCVVSPNQCDICMLQECSLDSITPCKGVGSPRDTTQVRSGGFSFPGCEGGMGSLDLTIASSDIEELVGVIPTGQVGLTITLTSERDIDIRLYDLEDLDTFPEGRAIVAWCNQNTEPDCNVGVLSSGSEETVVYKDMEVTYSGWNGITVGDTGDSVRKKGVEFVRIQGTTRTELAIKVFAYHPGRVSVDYRWDSTDNACCRGEEACRGLFVIDVPEKGIRDVGIIPSGKLDLELLLTSETDVDMQLYDMELSETATDTLRPIVVYCPPEDTDLDKPCAHAILGNDGDENEAFYRGLRYTYSGYNGIGGLAKGVELISIQGVSSSRLNMKVYGYEGGQATVQYTYYEPGGSGRR